MHPQHPGNLWLNTGVPMVSAPVAADEVLHVYEQQRTQTRGVPWGTPAIEAMQLLADYDMAEIVRKKVEACTVAFVINAEDDQDEAVAPEVLAADGSVYEKFEPGMIGRLRGGKDVKFNAPNAVGGYSDYKVASLQTIAAAYRMPYELLSGDLSKVNYSSMRGGLVEFRRLVRTVQRHILIQMALQPVWEWWCEIAYLAGEIDDPVVPVVWDLPRFEWVNPMEDVQAQQLAVRAGFRSWQDVVAEGGRDPDDVLDEIEAWNGRLDRFGIVLDTDPRRTAKTGVQQPVPEPDDTDQVEELAKPTRARPRRPKPSRGRNVGTCSTAARPARGRGAAGQLRR